MIAEMTTTYTSIRATGTETDDTTTDETMATAETGAATMIETTTSSITARTSVTSIVTGVGAVTVVTGIETIATRLSGRQKRKDPCVGSSSRQPDVSKAKPGRAGSYTSMITGNRE